MTLGNRISAIRSEGETVNAWNRDNEKKVMYLMVGEEDYVDDYLGPLIRKTGRIALLEFNSFIQHADIVVNLCHPSMGETSGAVIRALGLGKPCIVSDDAWFSELPDHVVLKLKSENIAEPLRQNLNHVLGDKELIEKLSSSARAMEYMQDGHGLKKISFEITKFLKGA